MKVHRMNIGIGIGMLALASVSFGQESVYRSVYTLKDLKIQTRPWGSGTISETDEAAYEGGHSVRITSRNFFQGGILAMDKPVDLSKTDPKSVLRIAIRTPQARVMTPKPAQGQGGAGFPFGGPGTPGQGGRGGGGGGAGAGAGDGGGEDGGGGAYLSPGSVGSGFAFATNTFPGQVGFQQPPTQGPPGSFPGSFPPGMTPGGQFPPGFGGFGGPQQQAPQQTLPPMQFLRLIIATTDGKKSETYLPVNQSQPDKAGWKTVGIPLDAINGFSKTNKVVKQVSFAADTLATFYIGGVAMVQDTTPIDGNIYARIKGVQNKFSAITFANLALNDTVEFRGAGTAGATILSYEWDFDASDGIQTDAVGQVVKCTFHKPGTYTITLTIKDKYGIKQPVRKTLVVTVNP